MYVGSLNFLLKVSSYRVADERSQISGAQIEYETVRMSVLIAAIRLRTFHVCDERLSLIHRYGCVSLVLQDKQTTILRKLISVNQFEDVSLWRLNFSTVVQKISSLPTVARFSHRSNLVHIVGAWMQISVVLKNFSLLRIVAGRSSTKFGLL